MLAVASILPNEVNAHSPIILVHGAANSAKVWTFWQRELAAHGWASHAIDLRGHGRSSYVDLSHTSMHDYLADVRLLIEQLAQSPVVIGWSMGGLIAMTVASYGDAVACVTLAPSAPARLADASINLRSGEFGPEEYGIISSDPEDQPAMPDLDKEERSVALTSLSRESRLARDERKAGIVIDSIACLLLIVTGTADTAWPRVTYDDLWLSAEFHSVEAASHWGLVLNRRVLATTVTAI